MFVLYEGNYKKWLETICQCITSALGCDWSTGKSFQVVFIRKIIVLVNTPKDKPVEILLHNYIIIVFTFMLDAVSRGLLPEKNITNRNRKYKNQWMLQVGIFFFPNAPLPYICHSFVIIFVRRFPWYDFITHNVMLICIFSFLFIYFF